MKPTSQLTIPVEVFPRMVSLPFRLGALGWVRISIGHGQAKSFICVLLLRLLFRRNLLKIQLRGSRLSWADWCWDLEVS